MTLPKARKILGKLAEKLTDDQVMEEIERSNMIAEILLMAYKEGKSKNNIPQINHA